MWPRRSSSSPLERPSGVRDGDHLKAWLLKVTANKCRNLLKSGWYRSRNELPESLPALERREDEILAAVLSLEEKYRLPPSPALLRGLFHPGGRPHSGPARRHSGDPPPRTLWMEPAAP